MRCTDVLIGQYDQHGRSAIERCAPLGVQKTYKKGV